MQTNNLLSYQDIQRMELKKRANNTQALNTLTFYCPNKFSFRGSKLYALGLSEKTMKNAFFSVDLPNQNNVATSLSFQIELEELTHNVHFSKEEELLRERLRQRVMGITSYTHFNKSNKCLFPSGESIFIYNLETKELNQLNMNLIESNHQFSIKSIEGKPKMDVKLSNDDKFISFILESNLFVCNLQTGNTIQLTFSNDIEIQNGVADYVMQEEFDRFTGYWWSTESKSNIYRISYIEVNNENIPKKLIPGMGISMSVEDCDVYNYPRAGESNAIQTLCMVEFDESFSYYNNTKFKEITAASKSEKNLFPWCEYILQSGWVDWQWCYLVLLDRLQQHACYILFNVETKEVTKVLEESIPEYWFNVKRSFKFLNKDKAIISSEAKTGFNHLYLLERNPSTVEFSCTELTYGDWMVENENIWVDEANIYFASTKDTPLESHLYKLNIKTKEITRLTTPGYFHFDITFNSDLTSFICTGSSLNSINQVLVYHKANNGEFVHTFNITYPLKSPEQLNLGFECSIPKIFNFETTDGITLYGCYFLPPNYDSNKKYPCVVYIYGGPHVQLVQNKFTLVITGRIQYLASLGYIVCIVDNRGSARRGLKFEGKLRGKMGQVEIEDQVQGLLYLINSGVSIDKKRIGITGWSYGGYLSLMALAQRPDIFKIAIAGGPVVDWRLYDTGYTERYMGLPNTSLADYDNASVLTYIKNCPEQPNRLLLIHGLLDENVHFKNTELLISELVRLTKPYQLNIFPEERHGVRHLPAMIHLLLSTIDFFNQNL
ncbi:hypothetical protein ABK040_008834 [Willaertia magna]